MTSKTSSLKKGDLVVLTLLFQGPRMLRRPAKIVAKSGELFDVEDADGKIWTKLAELSSDSPSRAVGIRLAPAKVEKKTKAKKSKPDDAASTPDLASSPAKTDPTGKVFIS